MAKNKNLLLTAEQAKQRQDEAYRKVMHAEVSLMLKNSGGAAIQADSRTKRNRSRHAQKSNAIKNSFHGS